MVESFLVLYKDAVITYNIHGMPLVYSVNSNSFKTPSARILNLANQNIEPIKVSAYNSFKYDPLQHRW